MARMFRSIFTRQLGSVCVTSARVDARTSRKSASASGTAPSKEQSESGAPGFGARAREERERENAHVSTACDVPASRWPRVDKTGEPVLGTVRRSARHLDVATFVYRHRRTKRHVSRSRSRAPKTPGKTSFVRGSRLSDRRDSRDCQECRETSSEIAASSIIGTFHRLGIFFPVSESLIFSDITSPRSGASPSPCHYY